MSGSKKKSLQPFRIDERDDFDVNQFATNNAGSMSPFGDDVVFPLPVEKLRYTHPSPENRPHLAGAAGN